MNSKVWIETSVVSYFTAWPSRDVVMAVPRRPEVRLPVTPVNLRALFSIRRLLEM